MWYSRQELKNMTEEELEKYESFLLNKLENIEFEEDGTSHTYYINYYPSLISLYKEMYKRAYDKHQLDPEKNLRELEYYKNSLIEFLVNYGGYLKTMYQKDNNAAVSALKKALSLNMNLPIVHYRLAFLEYKNNKYSRAITRFQKAIELNGNSKDIVQEYRLNDQQAYFAYRYLKSSALNLAVQSQSKEEHHRLSAEKEDAEGYEAVSLESLLKKDDEQLANQAYLKVTRQGDKVERTYCSREECWEAFESKDGQTLVLFFSDSEIILGCEKRSMKTLPIGRAKRLHHLLLETSESHPATRETMRDFFDIPNDRDFVMENTFVRAVSRIREDLQSVNTPDLISTTHKHDETAYYFNGACPIVVLYRSDADFILQEDTFI